MINQAQSGVVSATGKLLLHQQKLVLCPDSVRSLKRKDKVYVGV